MRRMGWGRVLTAGLSVLILAAGCTSTVAGHGQAAAPAGTGPTGLPGEQFAAEPADCREQLGQDHIYQIELNTDLGVSVIVEDWGSRTANLFTGDLNVVADALLRRLRAAGATDAKVLRRARPKVQGHQGLDFQISFTPLKPPRIKPIWLVRVVEDETALVFLQTIGSPKTKGTKVESTVRALQRRLIASLQLV